MGLGMDSDRVCRAASTQWAHQPVPITQVENLGRGRITITQQVDHICVKFVNSGMREDSIHKFMGGSITPHSKVYPKLSEF